MSKDISLSNTDSTQGKTAPLPSEIEEEIVSLIPALRAFSRSLCCNLSDAEDLVQETLIKALANLDKFEPGTRLRAWMFTIMRNNFYTSIRKSRRELTGETECVAEHAVDSYSQEWSMHLREVLNSVCRLPRHYRETLILVTMLGEPYEEAASILGCTVGTVKSRINRARFLLRDALGEAGEPEVRQAPRRR